MTRIRTNAIAMGGTFLVQAIFVFLQVKLLTRYLEPAEFGLYSTVFALGALLASFAELGFSVVLPRYGAKYEAEGRPSAFPRLVGAAIGLWFGAGLVLSTVLWLLALPAGPGTGDGQVPPALLLLGLAASLTFALRAYASAAFQGLRRMAPALVMEAVYMTGLTTWFLVLGDRLDAGSVFLGFLVFGLGAGAGGLGVFFLMARQRTGSGVGGEAPATAPPAPGASSAGSPRELLREIGPFWLGAFLTTVVAIALESADRLLLATLVPLELVAAWHVAGRLSLFLRKILFVPQQVAGPELAFQWERGARDVLADDLRLFARIEWLLGVLLAVGTALAARPVVLLVSNDRYEAAVPALTALAGALPILALQAPLTTFLRSVGRIGVTVTAELVWLVGSLAIGALLLPALGLAGFGLGAVVAALLALLYTLAAFRKRALPGPGHRFVVRHLALGLAAWALAALVARGMADWSPVAALALAGGVTLLLGGGLLRGGAFPRGERARLAALLGAGLPAGVVRGLLGVAPGERTFTRD
jgi:O-antigen/teichoic acid export membrane protein